MGKKEILKHNYFSYMLHISRFANFCHMTLHGAIPLDNALEYYKSW
jgi:hypothetical protein